LLEQLEAAKLMFGAKEQLRLAKLLNQISRCRFTDAESLIRFHEALMFMLAYPQSEELLKQTKEILNTFPQRIKYLEKIDADLIPFEEPEVSGIAGTSLTAIFSYPFSLWLSAHHTNETDIDWEGYEDEARIGATLPRLLPLMEEEALVEAHLSFQDYIHAAKPKNETDLAWMMKNFSRLDLSEKEKAELYESLKLYIRFAPNFESSRTGLRNNVSTACAYERVVFYHCEPLIQRRDVSIEKELNKPSLQFEKLSAKEGASILNTIRTASAVRYRELHGFMYADVKSFLKITLGRGVEVFLDEVLPEHRLPLRAYHSGFMFKNGVPIGYVECLSLFEKMEVGFNLYYTWREGETAWLYAQLLHIFKQHLGVTVFSVDPYQIGQDNEEGIESGAFWFYRKLGFKPVRDDITKIVEREEKKIATQKDYRTPVKILRRIATSHLIYSIADCGMWNAELGNKKQIGNRQSAIGNVLLAVQTRMSQRFNGDARKMREVTAKQISRLLNVDLNELKQTEQKAFSNFALVLSLIPNFSRWAIEEKELVREIIRAKGNGSEARYLHLIQQHKRLRETFIFLKLDDREKETR
jgi:hypothetical protein